MKRRLFHSILTIASLALIAQALGCADETPSPPQSLQTPRSFTLVRGPVCMDSVEPFRGGVQPSIRQCDDGERGAIGLVANQTGDSVSVADMSRDMRGSPQRLPRLVDLDDTIPGVNGIDVGSAPVEVAANDGTVAYAVNQADRSLSVINLWLLQSLPKQIRFQDTPKTARLSPRVGDEPGQLIVALTNPSRLWIHQDIDCDFPGQAGEPVDRRAIAAETGCQAVPRERDGQIIELPGTLSDIVVGPHGHRAYIVYSDRNFASTIALGESDLGESDLGELADVCLNGDELPCESDRVGLTFDCSSGVDADGDGLIDQDDPQCYGPRDRESPDGIGRNRVGACANTIDQDGDGLIDRDDPSCQFSGWETEEQPLLDDATFTCNDGRDNDGDGAVDYPADPACYGEVGRSERPVMPTGFTSVAVDPMGGFLYAVDRANNQVVVVDATRMELVDAFDTGGEDRTPFSSELGVPIAPSPIAVEGRVDRAVVWQNPDECDASGECGHAIVRYNYGAFVASDNGFAYNVSTMSTFCEVRADEDGPIVSSAEFFAGSEALFGSEAQPGSAERHCLQVPQFPLVYDVEACEAVDTCLQCQRAGGAGCESLCEDLADQRQACAGDRLVSDDQVRLAFSEDFQVQDASARTSRVLGQGSCRTPDSFAAAMRASSDGPVDVSCTSPIRPQPIDPRLDPDSAAPLLAERQFDRAQLLRDNGLILLPADELDDAERSAFDDDLGPLDVVALNLAGIDDQSVVNEAVTVAWEGVLPATARDGGLVSDTEPGLVDVASVDLCEAGVEQGDRLTIRTRPTTTDSTDIPERCQGLVDRDIGEDFRTWRVEEVLPHSLKVAVIDEDGFTDELPTRDCFAQGVRVAVRAHGEWIVYGDRSGFNSERTSVLGTCQPRYGAGHPRVGSRVQTGELFEGPYLSFRLFEGEVEPQRAAGEELSYRFSVQRNFRPDSFRTTTLLPSQVRLLQGLPAGPLLVVPDPSQNLLYVRNLAISSAQAAFAIR